MAGTTRILIAEDHPASRKLLEINLRKAGYDVVSAGDGREALGILRKEYVPIVICDWMMPEMDGLQLCREIRKGDFPGYVFTIMLTARDSHEDIVGGLTAGADEYLTKPITQVELVARLNTARRILELETSLKARNEEIKALSITDALTGAFNRLYMTDQLGKEITRADRFGHPLALAMCDVDNFKQVNDLYGHQTGDMILKSITECLKRSIRNGVDWIARYGGEEFLIVMPETSKAGACKAAERWRRLVEESSFAAEGRNIRITVSIGVAVSTDFVGSDGQLADRFIAAADKCLYEAKARGRNKVIGPWDEGKISASS